MISLCKEFDIEFVVIFNSLVLILLFFVVLCGGIDIRILVIFLLVIYGILSVFLFDKLLGLIDLGLGLLLRLCLCNRFFGWLIKKLFNLLVMFSFFVKNLFFFLRCLM